MVLGAARLRQPVEQAARHERGVVGARQVVQQHGELVAADPRHQVGGAGSGAQPLGHRLEHAVAGGVAEPVVDGLEAVEVEEHERAAGALAAGARERALERVEEERAVGQPRQAVVARETLEVGLGPLPLQEQREQARHVGEGGHPVELALARALPARLEHAQHGAARTHGHRQLHAGLGFLRALPDGGAVLEAVPRERGRGRPRRSRARRARRGAGEGERLRVALEHPQPGLAAGEPLHERVEHRGRCFDHRQRAGERLRRALARDRQPLAPAALAEVADVRAQQHAPLHVGRHHDHLDRQQRAVGAHRGRLAAAAEVVALAGHHELAQHPAHLVAQRRRHDGVGDLAPEHLGAAVAEEPARRRVELDDAALVVGGQDAVERRVEDQRLADLARAQLLLPLAGLAEGAHRERERGRAGALRPRLGVDESGDPLPGIGAVDQELDAHPVALALLACEPHHLPHHRHWRGAVGQLEREADLGPELQLAAALEQDAARPDVEHQALVLVGVRPRSATSRAA